MLSSSHCSQQLGTELCWKAGSSSLEFWFHGLPFAPWPAKVTLRFRIRIIPSKIIWTSSCWVQEAHIVEFTLPLTLLLIFHFKSSSCLKSNTFKKQCGCSDMNSIGHLFILLPKCIKYIPNGLHTLFRGPKGGCVLLQSCSEIRVYQVQSKGLKDKLYFPFNVSVSILF